MNKDDWSAILLLIAAIAPFVLAVIAIVWLVFPFVVMHKMNRLIERAKEQADLLHELLLASKKRP